MLPLFSPYKHYKGLYMEAFYKVTKNKEAKQPYHWVLFAPNNKIILTSENYSSKQMALRGIASVRVNCPYDENYERLIARDGSPYFNLVAQNGEIIGTSEMYSSDDARDAGIEAVKKYARDAEVRDETGEARSGIPKGEVKPIVSPQRPWISC